MDVYILNLQAEQKRRYICEGALFAMDTPFVHVKRWEAIDDLNYIKSREVLEAAIADGFPAFQSYLNRGVQNKEGIGVLTQTWNYCRFWRHVVAENKTVMLIQDDRRFRVPYPKMVEITEEVIYGPNFHLLSLWCRHHAVKDKYLPFRWISDGSPIAHGIYEGGADVGQIVSPKGAQWLLDIIGDASPRVEYAIRDRACNDDNFYTLVDESLNLEHLVPDKRDYIPSRIYGNSESSEDRYNRPISTTVDENGGK